MPPKEARKERHALACGQVWEGKKAHNTFPNTSGKERRKTERRKTKAGFPQIGG